MESNTTATRTESHSDRNLSLPRHGARQEKVSDIGARDEQNQSDRARRILRAFALSDDAPLALRNDAVFHIAQDGDAADQAWLREAYARIPNVKLRTDVMFHIAQSPNVESSRWLASVVTDARESDAQRKNALFHLAQRKTEECKIGEVEAREYKRKC